MSFRRNVSYALLSQIASAGFQALTGIVTARFLSVEGRGLYSLFFSNAAIVSSIISIGITQSIIFYKNRKDIDNGVLIGNGLIIYLLQILLIFFVFSITPNEAIAKLIGGGSEGLTIFFFIFALVLMSDNLLSGLMLGNHIYREYLIYITMQNAAIFFTVAPAFVLFYTSDLAIESRVITLLFLVCILWYWVLTKLNWMSISFDLAIFVKLVAFGVKNNIQNILGVLNNRAGLALIGILSNIEEVAIYSISLLVISLIRLVPDAVGTILLPKLTTLESNEHTRLSIFTLKFVIFFSIVLSVVLFPLIDILLAPIFGGVYSKAISPTQAMLVGAIFGSIYQVLTRVFTSDGQQEYSIYSSCIGFISMILISLLFIPRYGSVGAAISFIVGNMITAIFMIFFFCRKHKVPLMELLVPERADIDRVREQLSAVLSDRGSK